MSMKNKTITERKHFCNYQSVLDYIDNNNLIVVHIGQDNNGEWDLYYRNNES